MKFFGRYFAPYLVFLAALDGGLFFLAWGALGYGQHCAGCYFDNLANVKLGETSFLTAMFLLVAAAAGFYTRDAIANFRVLTTRFLVAWPFVFIPAAAFFLVADSTHWLNPGSSLGGLVLAILQLMLALFAVRAIIVWCFGGDLMSKRILVLGQGPLADATISFIRDSGHSYLQHIDTVPNEPPASPARNLNGNLALVAQPDAGASLLAIAQSSRIDEIVVAASDRRGLPVWELLQCKLAGVAVVDYLTFWERETGQVDIFHAGADWLAFSNGFRLDGVRRVVKRAMDIAVSLAFLIWTLPITLLTALAIRLETPGPIFYRQERVGLNGNLFHVWKFRSMRQDAEGDGVPRWAANDDDRVTRVGRLIRKARIDEIPQVFNVLSGEMSFIGPRPERPFFVKQLQREVPYYDLRHRVKPGITGWAQVNYPYGASIADAEQKLAYDLYYVKNQSVLLDLSILVRTVRVILSGAGAR